MTIANYSDLQSAIAGWLHRSDLTTIIPDFISLAEAKLNRVLRLRAMENVATGATGTTVSLPTGFVEMRSISATDGSTSWTLSYIPPDQIGVDTSAPTKYSIVGDTIYLLGTDASYTYTLTYYKKFDALSAGVNWLITNAPDAYLYATLLEAAPYLKDDNRLQTWASMLTETISQLNKADRNDRYGANLVVRCE